MTMIPVVEITLATMGICVVILVFYKMYLLYNDNIEDDKYI